MAGNKPHLTLSRDSVQLSIWKNRSAEGREYCSSQIQKRFKRKDSKEWETSTSLSDRDWLAASFLFAEAARRFGTRDFGDINRAAIGKEEPVATGGGDAAENDADPFASEGSGPL